MDCPVIVEGNGLLVEIQAYLGVVVMEILVCERCAGLTDDARKTSFGMFCRACVDAVLDFVENRREYAEISREG
jgi:hypothetical protein